MERGAVRRIVAGGQTGVDRAALDFALAHRIPCGGWCPKGRLAEDGVIASHYPLRETDSTDVAVRTEWNVRDSDGTLILTRGRPGGGTLFTVTCIAKHLKPELRFELHAWPDRNAFQDWLLSHRIHVLNIAGPLESLAPGVIYSCAYRLLERIFSTSGDNPTEARRSGQKHSGV